MKKEIKVTLKTPTENTKQTYQALVSDNKIVYQENDTKVTIIINQESVCLNRHNKDYEINFNYSLQNDQPTTYKIFGSSKEFILDIKTIKLRTKPTKIYIEYELDSELYKFNLEVL